MAKVFWVNLESGCSNLCRCPTFYSQRRSQFAEKLSQMLWLSKMFI